MLMASAAYPSTIRGTSLARSWIDGTTIGRQDRERVWFVMRLCTDDDLHVGARSLTSATAAGKSRGSRRARLAGPLAGATCSLAASQPSRICRIFDYFGGPSDGSRDPTA